MAVLIPNVRTRGVELADTGWFFDVTTEASVELSSKVAEDPVEDGSVINDHITNDAIRIRLAGIKTATPLDVTEQRQSRLEDTFNELLELWRARRTFEVFSPTFGTFPSMAITAISSSLSSGSGLMHSISIDLVELRIAAFESVIVPAFFPKKKRIGGLSSAAMAKVQAEAEKNKAAFIALGKKLELQAFSFQARKSQIAEQKDQLRQSASDYLSAPEERVSKREKELYRQKINANPEIKAIIFGGA